MRYGKTELETFSKSINCVTVSCLLFGSIFSILIYYCVPFFPISTTALKFPAMFSVAVHYTTPYCTALQCTIHCTELHCNIHCTELHCTIHCTSLHWHLAILYTILNRTKLYCNELDWTLLHCTVMLSNNCSAYIGCQSVLYFK